MDAPRRVVGLGLRTLLAFAVVACGTSQVSPGATLGTATTGPPPPTQRSTGAPVLSPDGGRAADELFGDWLLVAGHNEGTPIPLLAPFPISLTIAPRRVSGQSACNNYQADASVDAVNFGVSTPAMSAMGCDPPRGAVDDAYISALFTIETWQLVGGQLFLRGPDVELQFRPIGSIDLQAITDRTWILQTLAASGGLQSPAHPGGTLELGSDGQLVGSTGCRTLRGTYVEQRGEILATRLTTDGVCAPAVLDQDSLVVTVLGDGFTAAVIDGALVTSAGDNRLIYAPAEVPTT